jgi:uncharacterized OsmC-like protein
MSEEKILNGVNVDVVEGVVKAINEEPSLAKSKFRAHNKWINGPHNQSSINGYYTAGEEMNRGKPFVMDADEPPILAGEDIGANPVEYVLHALAACLTTTLVYHAALRGIELEEVESELEGDLDVRGLLGLSDEVRRGYQQIRVNFKVKTDAENIEKLKAFSKLSPVVETISKGTQVNIQIERK